MRTSESTLRMKREFMTLHNRGLSIKEIAGEFNLNPVTVYAHLGSIAKENGCTREELLKQVHKQPLTYDRQFEPVEEVDIPGTTAKFNALKETAKELSSLMAGYIQKQEKEEAHHE